MKIFKKRFPKFLTRSQKINFFFYEKKKKNFQQFPMKRQTIWLRSDPKSPSKQNLISASPINTHRPDCGTIIHAPRPLRPMTIPQEMTNNKNPTPRWAYTPNQHQRCSPTLVIDTLVKSVLGCIYYGHQVHIFSSDSKFKRPKYPISFKRRSSVDRFG